MAFQHLWSDSSLDPTDTIDPRVANTTTSNRYDQSTPNLERSTLNEAESTPDDVLSSYERACRVDGADVSSVSTASPSQDHLFGDDVGEV